MTHFALTFSILRRRVTARCIATGHVRHPSDRHGHAWHQCGVLNGQFAQSKRARWFRWTPRHTHWRQTGNISQEKKSQKSALLSFTIVRYKRVDFWEFLLCVQWAPCHTPAVDWWYFSKVGFIVFFCSKCSSELTFENFYQQLQLEKLHRSLPRTCCVYEMSHATHVDESRHTCGWVTSHIWMSHSTHVDESRHTCGRVFSNVSSIFFFFYI